MLCPKCKQDQISVIDSRDLNTNTIRRRRECNGCRYRFTTHERIERVVLTVVKRNGSREPYDREKVVGGIAKAIEKRGIETSRIEQMVDQIETKLIEEGESEVPARRIGLLVIKKLRQIDDVAYLRFTSVFKEFKNLTQFERELEKIKK